MSETTTPETFEIKYAAWDNEPTTDPLPDDPEWIPGPGAILVGGRWSDQPAPIGQTDEDGAPDGETYECERCNVHVPDERFDHDAGLCDDCTDYNAGRVIL